MKAAEARKTLGFDSTHVMANFDRGWIQAAESHCQQNFYIW
jgi:hypothetical protein